MEWFGHEPDWSGATAEATRLVREFLGSDRAAALKKPEGNLLLFLHRGAFDVFQRFRGTLDPVFDGIIKALFG